MLLRLDPRDDAPLFVQLANTLRIAVLRGDASPGERLPSARELAASLDINVHTVLHAYQELRDEGGRAAPWTWRNGCCRRVPRLACCSTSKVLLESGKLPVKAPATSSYTVWITTGQVKGIGELPHAT
jgi:DNA-binding transcriptional MocR family regulator